MTLRWILDLGANGDKKKFQHRVRLLRIGVFMVMTIGFLYQASKVVEEYLSFPSAVDVRIEGTEVLLFPGLSVCVTNWISKTKLCEHYQEFCDTNNTSVEELKRLLLTGGNLGDIAHTSEDVLQIGFVNPTQYFFEFYLSPNVTRQSYSRLPSQMCYTMNWRHDSKIDTVHQNVLAFEMNVLFAWPEDDLIEMDEFEMNLGFHHVDTNTAGKKHAMAFKPSGDFVFGIVQEGVVSLPAPFATKCDNYSRYLRLPKYKVQYSKEICYEECRKEITRQVCGCIPNDYAWRNHISEKVCDLAETIHCVHKDGRAMYSVVCNERCHTACRETIYKATQSAWKQETSMSMEGLTYVKVRALMTSRSVEALHFIPLLTGTQVLGLVGGYSGFWMGVAIVVGATESVRVVFDFCRRRVRSRLHKAEISFLFRVCKMLMVQGCFVACAFSIYGDYENYRHYYTAVTYEQQNIRGVFFPAVTICSYEAVNFTRMCAEYGRYNKCAAATFDTTVGNDIIAMKYVINYTYPPADVFSNCTMTFSGEICESFNCDNLWDPTYTFVKTGVCFILNIGRSPELQRCREQYKYRLNFRVRADTKDPRNENMAFSALLHGTSSYTSGIIHTFRFQAGRKYTISVAQTELVSLPLPYETRCIDYVATADESLYDEKEIQEEECSEFCVAQRWIATCGCFSKMYAVKHRMKGTVCEYVPHMRCIDELIRQKWFMSCQNICTRGCKDTRYRGLMFQTGFITDYVRYENLEADLTVVLGSTKRKIVSNLPRMTMADFLLYLSGHVSMWLGVSLIAAGPLVVEGVKYVQRLFDAFATSMGLVVV
ncbi:uncharacterized protein LOC142575939 [Dermacentor variabilis]|uniref:uncharacterized protein LOC142575939 n=1 Tax=Dermacentor variabilis TaxID=34621 RepID=UPI003F5B5368